jgi:four helix bundle protein
MNIQGLSKELSFSVFEICNALKNEHREFEISSQLKRSATSVAANIQESQGAESKKDFSHKLSIARKECKETIYWLELVNANVKCDLKLGVLITKYNQLSYMLWRIIDKS